MTIKIEEIKTDFNAIKMDNIKKICETGNNKPSELLVTNDWLHPIYNDWLYPWLHPID